MFFIVFIAVSFAIDNLTDLLTTLPQLTSIREWWKNKFPKLARLSWCVYCQSFWLSIAAAFFTPRIPGIDDVYLNYGLTVLILHRLAQFINAIYARHLQILVPQENSEIMADEQQPGP